MDAGITKKDGSSATVWDLLVQKHPEAAPTAQDALGPGESTDVNAVDLRL